MKLLDLNNSTVISWIICCHCYLTQLVQASTLPLYKAETINQNEITPNLVHANRNVPDSTGSVKIERLKHFHTPVWEINTNTIYFDADEITNFNSFKLNMISNTADKSSLSQTVTIKDESLNNGLYKYWILTITLSPFAFILTVILAIIYSKCRRKNTI